MKAPKNITRKFWDATEQRGEAFDFISVEALKEYIDQHKINDYRYGESYMDADELLKFIKE